MSTASVQPSPVSPPASAPSSELSPLNDLPPTPRDVQRAALADLLTLSQACTDLEIDLQAQHRAATDEAQKSFDKNRRDADYRFDQHAKQTRAKAEERLQEAVAHTEQQVAQAKAINQEKRKRAAGEFDKIKSDLKGKFDQAVWLADSVLEAAQYQAHSEYKAAAEKHNDVLAHVSSLEFDAARLVEKYGTSPIPADQPTLTPEAARADAPAALAAEEGASERLTGKLKHLFLARLFVGIRPWALLTLVCLAAGGYAHYREAAPTQAWLVFNWPLIGKYAGIALGACVVGGVLLKLLALSQVKKTYAPLRTHLANARVASAAVLANAAAARDEALARASRHREAEVKGIRDRMNPVQVEALRKRDTAVKAADDELQQALARHEAVVQKHRSEVAEWQQKHLDAAAGRATAERDRAQEMFDTGLAASVRSFDERRGSLRSRWNDGLARIQAPIGPHAGANASGDSWGATDWSTWSPPSEFPKTVTFGTLAVDLKAIAAGIPRDGQFELALPDQFKVPALLAFPHQASVLIQTDPGGRDEGVRALQALMVRLLTALPPGRARFTILDPVGLGQSFAGFMHLADHDDALVNGRIWTSSEQIEQRLSDLTEHMETVIQKYLRNEFETIDDYNRQAGELAEPYRFLVVADFPNGFEGETWRRLVSIVKTGARCGVYVLMLRDTRQALPGAMHLEDLEAGCVNVTRENGKWIWQDETFKKFPLTLAAPPSEDVLTRIVHRVGKAAKEANRVEVSFDAIAPKFEQFWTGSAASELAVPVGRMGATRLQYFRCGKGMAQHALTAGKTGSGKSTLLHAMVTNLAMWYSPDEVEFYLIDFKKGVEFKTYADYKLPHARAIAVESDREFGLSVLQRIDAELTRRGELYRKAGVQDLASYRETPGALVMPRTLLIIDEYQEFFSEDDKLAQDASLLLDRLVRQGRAFGVHVFLGSQTIGGAGGLARTTIGQMAIRIALQCSETDSQLILGDNNSAARLLSRPGEAIYNDAGGLVENNSPFQVAWLSDAKREKFLAEVQKKQGDPAVENGRNVPIVFEGNAPADIAVNARLGALTSAKPQAPVTAPLAWVGEPVAIKAPTAVHFRRQSGTNLLLIGQQEEQALALIESALLSIVAQQPGEAAKIFVADGTPTDSPLAGRLPALVAALGQPHRMVDYRGIEDVVNELTEEVARRQASGDVPSSIYLVVNGLQRYRMLRKTEEEFSFSVSDEPKKASAGKQFADLLREGPPLGVHVIAWCDTLASVERTLERGSVREFDHRVLFQMSANDSSNLIDSPAANRLGFFRALLYSEEQGLLEKFRPYGLANAAWIRDAAEKLARRA